MRLRIRVQRHLVVAHRVEDSGEWLFTLCRRGMEQLLGQKLKPGTELTVEVSGKIIEEAMDEYIQLRFEKNKLHYRYRMLVRNLLDGEDLLDSTDALEGVGFGPEWSDWIEVPKEKDK